MISMYAEYSGRTLYVALSSDTIEGAKNGDKLYEMDTGKRYVCTDSGGGMNRWVEQPEDSGGGGYTKKLCGRDSNYNFVRQRSIKEVTTNA